MKAAAAEGYGGSYYIINNEGPEGIHSGEGSFYDRVPESGHSRGHLGIRTGTL